MSYSWVSPQGDENRVGGVGAMIVFDRGFQPPSTIPCDLDGLMLRSDDERFSVDCVAIGFNDHRTSTLTNLRVSPGHGFRKR